MKKIILIPILCVIFVGCQSQYERRQTRANSNQASCEKIRGYKYDSQKKECILIDKEEYCKSKGQIYIQMYRSDDWVSNDYNHTSCWTVSDGCRMRCNLLFKNLLTYKYTSVSNHVTGDLLNCMNQCKEEYYNETPNN